MTTLHCIRHDTGPNPQHAIIMLHGLGADGSDFEPWVNEVDLSAVGPVRWVLPSAPLRPVTINGGHVMRAWYDILELSFQRQEDEAGLLASVEAVHALIDHEVAQGIAPERIVLAGFSQGCAMTLLAGLRYGQRLAGLAGLSGYLPLSSTLATHTRDAQRLTPIFLAHGRQDPVVPLNRGQAAHQALSAAGLGVEWHDYAMPHSVCLEEVKDLRAWLLRVLG